jgi:uncharacterized protein (DUF4415 family)
MKRFSTEQLKERFSKTDWARVASDVAKRKRIVIDDDNIAPTTAEVAEAVRARGARGPQKAPTKKAISLRLSPDVLAGFRNTGTGWQTRIDSVLRAHLWSNPAHQPTKTPHKACARVAVEPRAGGRWAVQTDGASRADSLHDRKSDAVARARNLAENKQSEWIIRDRAAKIAAPRRIKG